jgi:hypothetical protein|tara:strand:- start:97 stop:252 length:156 start_codon:yes stop_codon:yes gene_type:complete
MNKNKKKISPVKFYIVAYYLKYIFIPYLDLRFKLGIPHIPKNSKYRNRRFK